MIEDQFNHLLPFALGVVGDAFACYEEVPFGLQIDDFVDYSTRQFDLRYSRLEKAYKAVR